MKIVIPIPTHRSRGRFASGRTKVNILVLPAGSQWSARAYRTDNGALLFESSLHPRSAWALQEARRWAQTNRYAIGRIAAR